MKSAGAVDSGMPELNRPCTDGPSQTVISRAAGLVRRGRAEARGLGLAAVTARAGGAARPAACSSGGLGGRREEGFRQHRVHVVDENELDVAPGALGHVDQVLCRSCAAG
jgi:hypothetical protein